MNYINNFHLYFILLLISFLPLSGVHADGSKDLYPTGAQGGRAKLKSWRGTSSESFPFPQNATHFVYAVAGEVIAMANSEIGYGNSKIIFTRPDGTLQVYSQSATAESNINLQGRISNRVQELAGPRPNGASAGERYTPFYYTVAQTGIHKVEFVAPGETDVDGCVTDQSATESWRASARYDLSGTDSASNNTALFTAWDITVFSNNTASAVAQKGRVYMNMLLMELNLPNVPKDVHRFYGEFYALTKDGYVFRVDNNGNSGFGFTFYANNKGFYNTATKIPIYKSLNTSALATVQAQSHDPRAVDTESDITQKLFYTNPLDVEVYLPAEATGAVPGGATWLKNPPKLPSVQEMAVIGLDETPGQISNKGGNIRFRTDMTGSYTITITSTTPGFTTKIMTGTAIAGINNHYWDGKDGAGIKVPVGTSPVKITVQLRGAEVHFPFIDMEINPTGFILELLNAPSETSNNDKFSVYWNDDDITRTSNNNQGSASNPKNASVTPQDSRINGHKWGENLGSGSSWKGFGNARSIDTWTYILGEEKTVETEVTVKEADLKISNIEVNGANSLTVYLGDEITYTVKVKNDGPSDVFEAPFAFTLPEGFTGKGTPVFLENGCGSQAVAVSYDAVKCQYTSKLNLPNDCEITYTFKVQIGATAEPGVLKADATILRPNDVTDPDATNISSPDKPLAPVGQDPFSLDFDTYYFPPTNPYFECANNFPVDNPQRGICNNIKDINITLIRQADLAIEKTVSNPKPKIGDIITFTLKVTNNGSHIAKNIIITDIVPSGYIIGTINDGGTNNRDTITWNSTTTSAKLGELAKDAIATVTFQAVVKASGGYVNMGKVTGDGVDPDLTNNETTAKVSFNNYWHGTLDNDWSKNDNWTANYVPGQGEDVEFATNINNNGSPADKDLHLDKDRVIGDLINASDKNLVVTTGNELVIEGEVKDENPAAGTIIVKSSPTEPTGTLLFTDPTANTSVNATVEFYNKAHECATCGFYRKQWQYFGIPVQSSDFPYLSPQVETVNQWVEPFNGNKWQPVPFAPELKMMAFKGYEMTNSSNALPTHIYSFVGTLHVGDATIPLTRSVNVNYPGMNLIGNSCTAAIPITSLAINFGSVTLSENTAYLFNTGTRDQWRKLNGGIVGGVAAGQYQAVPFNLAGQAEIPDRILSMHAFMLNVTTPGNIILKYDELIKNELNPSTTMYWKSASIKSNPAELPHIVMDVISSESADRVWIFEYTDATSGFDNGWDGYKMKEGDLIQAYVSGGNQSDYQIATVPEIVGTTISVTSDLNENYSINLSVTSDVESRNLFLRDLFTGRSYPIVNNAEYVVVGTNVSNNYRFKIETSTSGLIEENPASSLINIYVKNNIIIVDNQSEEDSSATIYDLAGRLVANKQAPKNQITEFTDIWLDRAGIYIVRVIGKTKSVNKTDWVLLK